MIHATTEPRGSISIHEGGGGNRYSRALHSRVGVSIDDMSVGGVLVVGLSVVDVSIALFVAAEVSVGNAIGMTVGKLVVPDSVSIRETIRYRVAVADVSVISTISVSVAKLAAEG